MDKPLRRNTPAPEGALIRMTRDSPLKQYRKGDMAIRLSGWMADFNNLGNETVTGNGIHSVAARYYLVAKQTL